MTKLSVNEERLKRGLVYRETISAATLEKMSGSQFTDKLPLSDHSGADKTILKGRVQNLDCRSSLSVHATDIIEVSDHKAEALLQPALTCSLILQGKADGKIGAENFSLDASESPMGYLWSNYEPVRWVRYLKKDNHVRKVNIRLDHSWLASIANLTPSDEISQFLLGFMSKPYEMRAWKPTQRSISLAEMLIQSDSTTSFADKLHTESRALEIFSEALDVLVSHEVVSSKPTNDNKAHLIRQYIEEHVEENLSLASIARSLGMAINTMQRLFKASYGMTVMDYLRERRLEIAKDAMEHDGLTIAQAAFKAGYGSPANFSTAFKRVYGYSPSHIQK